MQSAGKPLRVFALYALALAVCILATMWVLDWRPSRLAIPQAYDGDALFYAALVKGVIEHGWYLTNPALGFPGQMDLRDFPGGDNLCVLIIKVLGLFRSNCFAVTNGFFLLTFLLTTATSLYAMRSFGLRAATAVALSVLYAFLPYHFFRGTSHLFYSAYFMVPLAVVVAHWIASGSLIDRHTGAQAISPRRSRLCLSLIFCTALGCNMVYYPFFAA